MELELLSMPMEINTKDKSMQEIGMAKENIYNR